MDSFDTHTLCLGWEIHLGYTNEVRKVGRVRDDVRGGPFRHFGARARALAPEMNSARPRPFPSDRRRRRRRVTNFYFFKNDVIVF